MMDEFILKGYEDLEISTQIVIREALLRKITVEILDRKNHFIRLKKNGKSEIIKEASKTSLDSYLTYLCMENKTISKILLEECGVPTPQGKAFFSAEDAIDYYKKNSNKKIVIKPVTTNFGIGVSIIEPFGDPEAVFKIIQSTFQFSNSILLEEFVEGDEYRFLVLGREVVGVCKREPANITGNGQKNIQELVDLKNLDPRRGKGHVTPLEKIELGEVELEILKQKGLSPLSIPKLNEKVYLRKNSNISTGGDSIDFTEEANIVYKKIAIKAANSVGAKICGVDIITKNIEEEKDATVLEINFNPVLYIHEYPYKGKNRKIGAKILDLLGF